MIGGTLGFLACVLYIPGLRDLLGFAYLYANDVLLAIAAGATGVVGFELFKWVKATGLNDPLPEDSGFWVPDPVWTGPQSTGDPLAFRLVVV